MESCPCNTSTVQVKSANDIIWWISQAHTGQHWRKQKLLCPHPLRCTFPSLPPTIAENTPTYFLLLSLRSQNPRKHTHTLPRTRRRLDVKWCSRGGYNIKSHYPKLELQKGWAIGTSIKAAFSRRFVLTQGSNNLTRAITPFPRQP